MKVNTKGLIMDNLDNQKQRSNQIKLTIHKNQLPSNKAFKTTMRKKTQTKWRMTRTNTEQIMRFVRKKEVSPAPKILVEEEMQFVHLGKLRVRKGIMVPITE